MSLRRRSAVAAFLLPALLLAARPALAAEPPPVPRADRVRAATVDAVVAGGLALGGLALVSTGALLFPVAWVLQRPFHPPVAVGEGWEHAGAMVSMPLFAAGTGLWVVAGGFAVMAGAQVALLR